MPPDREALLGATNRFVAFFRELGETFIERDDLLKQIALALLGREHVLMTGPPGTAKSKLAQVALGRILCEETRQPSLFARQFTESTVHTDLVGPIDFKTLMETGRSEHFTDEGMLGATHAFLDEVFDGRDMLLRSTLNLLNERELKQGTKITRGKIECALMTTNRYLVEVLASDRLVAFVDRIAFLNFVPKGFANEDALAEILRRQVAGRASAPPHAPLSVQDVDLLQEAVEGVSVSEAMCSQVAALARSFDVALAAARRADPSFTSSRYVSTRGIVRLGELLRAICFYDWAFNDRGRPMAARASDLAGLRLGLTLCGPDVADTVTLLENETDARERRQLGIVRAERMMFDRCLTELPIAPEEPTPPPVPTPPLPEITAATLAAKAPAHLLELAYALGTAGAGPQGVGKDLGAQLEATLQELADRAVRAGLRPDHNNRKPADLVADLARLADEVDQVSPAHRPTTRWLRGKALDLAARIAAVGPSPFSAGMNHARAAVGDLAAMTATVTSQLERIQELASLRAGLLQAGADETPPATADTGWKDAVEVVAQRLWPDLAAGFAAHTRAAITRFPTGTLQALIEAISPGLQVVRDTADRLSALGGDGNAFFARIVTAAIAPLVSHSLTSQEAEQRSILADSLATDLAVMAEAGLLDLLPEAILAQWIAEAFVRPERAEPLVPPNATEVVRYGAYRKLRNAMPRATLAYTLVELLARLPSLQEKRADPDRIVQGVAALVGNFPPGLRAKLADLDLVYLGAPVSLLERWWQQVSDDLPADPEEALDELMKSSFFAVTHDECALARFDLEGQLVKQVFESVEIGPLCTRLAAIASASTERVARLSAQRLDSAAPGEGVRRAVESPS